MGLLRDSIARVYHHIFKTQNYVMILYFKKYLNKLKKEYIFKLSLNSTI